MKHKKKILKLDNEEIKPIEFGEIIVKYQHGKPVLVLEREQIKLNGEIYTKEKQRPVV